MTSITERDILALRPTLISSQKIYIAIFFFLSLVISGNVFFQLCPHPGGREMTNGRESQIRGFVLLREGFYD
jgi:hypothetical protein